MTYHKTLGILCPNQVLAKGWREERVDWKDTKRSSIHLSFDTSLGVVDISYRSSNTFD